MRNLDRERIEKEHGPVHDPAFKAKSQWKLCMAIETDYGRAYVCIVAEGQYAPEIIKEADEIVRASVNKP